MISIFKFLQQELSVQCTLQKTQDFNGHKELRMFFDMTLKHVRFYQNPTAYQL